MIICPGIHEPELTESFISEWLNLGVDKQSAKLANILVFPGQGVLTLSAASYFAVFKRSLGESAKIANYIY